MGRCICRGNPDDFGAWCEQHQATIEENVEEKHDVKFDGLNGQHCKWFEEEADKLWDDSPEPSDCDPRGGDGDDD